MGNLIKNFQLFPTTPKGIAQSFLAAANPFGIDPAANAISKAVGKDNKAADPKAASAPTPGAAIPPITMQSPAVLSAMDNFAQSNLLRKSVKRTILAGDSGSTFGGGGVGGVGTGTKLG